MSNYHATNDSSDKYKNTLMQFIQGTYDVSDLTATGLDDYITALSYYLTLDVPAYLYNAAYLTQQHEQFKQSLDSFREKYRLLERIIHHPYLQKYHIEIALHEITLILNHFLMADSLGKIDFQKDFSLSGGKTAPKGDVITVQCKDISLSHALTTNKTGRHDNQSIQEDVREICKLIDRIILIKWED